MIKLKWIVIGLSAYPICPRCGAYPLIFYGLDEYHNYIFQCKRCGIAIVRKTPLKKLQEKAIKRFWGEQVVKKS